MKHGDAGVSILLTAGMVVVVLTTLAWLFFGLPAWAPVLAALVTLEITPLADALGLRGERS